MKKLALAFGIWLSLASASFGQTTFAMPPPAGVALIGLQVVASCGGASLTAGSTPAYAVMDTTGKLCTAASVSASISGFPTVQSTGTPISVTTASTTGTLPTGTVVVASNVGATNGAYCKLGATATTSDQLIPPNSWFAFTVGANTQLSCITSTLTTTVNMVGGSGLPTGSGGGGGGSGGGGAITAALGSYVAGALSAGAFATGAGVDGWDLTQGTKADAAWTTGSGSVVALLKAIATAEIVTNRAVNVAQMGGTVINSGCVSNYGTAPSAVACPSSNVFVTNSTTAIKGSSPVVNGASNWNTIAASQTAQILSATSGGTSGTTGDYLSFCILQPSTTAAGTMTIADNTTTIFTFTTGTLSNLAPISIPIGAVSKTGGWKVTTGANETATCVGSFT